MTDLHEGYVEALTYGVPTDVHEFYVEALTTDAALPIAAGTSRLYVATPGGWVELQGDVAVPFD